MLVFGIATVNVTMLHIKKDTVYNDAAFCLKKIIHRRIIMHKEFVF